MAIEVYTFLTAVFAGMLASGLMRELHPALRFITAAAVVVYGIKAVTLSVVEGMAVTLMVADKLLQ